MLRILVALIILIPSIVNAETLAPIYVDPNGLIQSDAGWAADAGILSFRSTNVGIGTTIPAAKLEISGAGVGGHFTVLDDGAGKVFDIGQYGNIAVRNGTDGVNNQSLTVNSGGDTGHAIVAKSFSASQSANIMEVRDNANVDLVVFTPSGAVQATPSGLTAASGFSSFHRLIRSTSANADGTSIPQGFEAGVTVSGANNTAQVQGSYLQTTNSSTATISNQITALGYVNVGVGTTNNASAYLATPVLTSTGNIVTSMSYFNATAPSVSSTGDITGAIYGFRAQNIGRSAATTVSSFSAADITKGSGNAIGYEGNVSSATGKYNLYMSGTADNYLAGNVGIGTTIPTQGLDIRETGNLELGVRITNPTNSTAAGANLWLTQNGTSGLVLGFYPSAHTSISSWASSGVVFGQSAAANGLVIGSTSGAIRIQNGVGVETARFEGGNVGVGTTVPQSLLTVGTGGYLQFRSNSAGAPTAGDCDADSERGRLVIDTTNNRLYVCNGGTRLWDYVSLTD